MATKLIKDLPLVEVLSDTDDVLIQTASGTRRASLAQIKAVSKGEQGEKGDKGETGETGATPSITHLEEAVEVAINDIEQRANSCLPIFEGSTDARLDYLNNEHGSIKEAMDANVNLVLGEVNTVAYEGQYITATNTIKGEIENATLKGQTLVNHLLKCKSNVTSASNVIEFALPMNVAKKYILKFRINSLPTLNESDYRAVKFEWYTGGTTGGYYNHFKQNVTIGKDEYVIIPPYTGEVTRANFSIWSPSYESGTLDIDVAIFEYQEGMENWDIPYFEGMASVVNPSVTSVGKNLVNPELFRLQDNLSGDGSEKVESVGDDIIFYGANKGYYLDVILKENTSYYINYESRSDVANIRLFDLDGWQINNLVPNDLTKDIQQNTIITTNKKCRLRVWTNGSVAVIRKLIVAEVAQAIPYEPYKSNTVAPTEEVVLRSLPNGVCDTLNLITGEYVQRVTEVTFSNTSFSNWQSATTEIGDYIRFSQDLIGNKKTSSVIANYYVRKYPSEGHGEYEYVFILENTLYFQVKKERLSTLDKSGLLTYLASNPLTLQYELATPIVKIVDLTGGLNSYRGITHYLYSGGEGSLIPTLSINVPTHLSAFISKQRSIIEEQARTIAEQEEAQNLLIETQLSWYEATTAISPLSLDENETQVPDYMQQLYNLAYERGIRTRKN